MKAVTKTEKRMRRRNRIRAKVAGTAERPRLSVFRSNRFISVQIINDQSGTTLASASSRGMAQKPGERAKEVGKAIAKVAKEKGIRAVVFDRGGYLYSGAIKALADSAREGGLEF